MEFNVEELAFNRDGLIPAIAQDANSNEVLMMAWMNAEAVK
ncbi:MAG: phosphoribosyl-AMP cyclohydrolase, partial [Paracoccaceae bacterium]